MRKLLDRYLPARAPDDGGGAAAAGGAAAVAGAAPAAGDGGGAPGAAAATAATGAAAAGDGGGSPAAGAAAAPYRPQGLPETMFGKDDRETMDKMATALAGYRTRDSAVPEKAEAYATFDTDKIIADMKLDASVAPHLKQLENDPIMKAVGAYALGQKVPAPVVQGIVATAYAEAVKAGLMEAPIDVAAERAALLPESAKNLPKAQQDAAIDARLKQTSDFIDVLTKPGADGKSQLPKDVGEHAKLMLMDTAKGNAFLEFFMAQMTGQGRAAPQGGGPGNPSGGANSREALRVRAALPENTVGNPKFNQASWEALQEDYRKLLPD